jgi:hypothetical protein
MHCQQAADVGIEWKGQEVSKSERPELGAARVVISGAQLLLKLCCIRMFKVSQDTATFDMGLC